MNTILPLSWPQLRTALFLENPAFEVARSDRNAVRNAILRIVIIALVAGLLTFVVNLFQGDRSLAIARQSINQARTNLNAGLANADPDTRAQILGYLDAVDSMVRDLAGVQPRLGRPVADFFQALGHLVTQPLAWLGGWLGYLLWVLLFARLLGGQGSLPATMGATSLFVLPHLLDILAPIPGLGVVVGFLTTLWGIAIYVKGVEVSQRFGLGKALLATILPALLLGILILFAIFLYTIVVILVASGSRSG
jgi:hypothetical protein